VVIERAFGQVGPTATSSSLTGDAAPRMPHALAMKPIGPVVLAALLAHPAVACRRDDRAAAPVGRDASAAAPVGHDARAAAPAATDAARVRGAQLIGTLKQQLITRLTAAMADGVPAAIAVCHTEAPAIAGTLSVDGVAVGRATRKPRNPDNLASGWQADALDHFETLVAAGTPLAGASYVHRLPGGGTAYAEPLVIQPLCLGCHGAELAADVAATLAERYPDDHATGYQLDELRGIAWATMPP
jgi:hypothetical protein